MANELEFEVLEGDALAAEVEKLDGWSLHGIKLIKTYENPTFPAAIELVNRVAQVAESFNHHPDIYVNFKKVTMQLWTHKLNATTRADLQMAREIDRVA